MARNNKIIFILHSLLWSMVEPPFIGETFGVSIPEGFTKFSLLSNLDQSDYFKYCLGAEEGENVSFITS